MNPKQSRSSDKSQRAWTDLVFELYVEGSLSPLSAGEVRRSIDWIASHPSQLEQMERSPQELRSRLIAWVTDWARAQEQPASASMGREVAMSRVKTRDALLTLER
jgi:hypothetical protein